MSFLRKMSLSEAEVYVDVSLTADAKQFSSRRTSTIVLNDDGCGVWNNEQGERVSFDMLFNAGESGMARRIVLLVLSQLLANIHSYFRLLICCCSVAIPLEATLVVWDPDMITQDDKVGIATVQLSDLRREKFIDFGWVPLLADNSDTNSLNDADRQHIGEIHVKVEWLCSIGQIKDMKPTEKKQQQDRIENDRKLPPVHAELVKGDELADSQLQKQGSDGTQNNDVGLSSDGKQDESRGPSRSYSDQVGSESLVSTVLPGSISPQGSTQDVNQMHLPIPSPPSASPGTKPYGAGSRRSVFNQPRAPVVFAEDAVQPVLKGFRSRPSTSSTLTGDASRSLVAGTAVQTSAVAPGSQTDRPETRERRLPSTMEIWNRPSTVETSIASTDSKADIKTQLIHSRLDRLETAIQQTQKGQEDIRADLHEIRELLKILVPANAMTNPR